MKKVAIVGCGAMGAGIAQDLFGSESPLGQTITVGSTKFTVIGVMESKGIVSDVDYDGRVYLPIGVVLDKFMTTGSLGGDRVRTIYVKADSKDNIPSVIAQITALLAARHDVDREEDTRQEHEQAFFGL